MSEYQYYEFQAIDRALRPKEMAHLRGYSTRATITPTSFVNHYEWGNFKGNEDAWVDRFFDAFLYTASWGTNILNSAFRASAFRSRARARSAAAMQSQHARNSAARSSR